MRDILFRGRIEDNGMWVYGYYAYLRDATGGNHLIFEPAHNPDESNTTHFVDPETVGQYTGFDDMDSKPIFEGDIVKGFGDGDNLYSVVFLDGSFCFCPSFNPDCYIAMDMALNDEMCCVVGNIYDNPELLINND